MECKPYPTWICFDCGKKYGRHQGGICTVHLGICDVCGQEKPVTEPRDFGHLLDGWENTPDSHQDCRGDDKLTG